MPQCINTWGIYWLKKWKLVEKANKQLKSRSSTKDGKLQQYEKYKVYYNVKHLKSWAKFEI